MGMIKKAPCQHPSGIIKNVIAKLSERLTPPVAPSVIVGSKPSAAASVELSDDVISVMDMTLVRACCTPH